MQGYLKYELNIWDDTEKEDHFLLRYYALIMPLQATLSVQVDEHSTLLRAQEIALANPGQALVFGQTKDAMAAVLLLDKDFLVECAGGSFRLEAGRIPDSDPSLPKLRQEMVRLLQAETSGDPFRLARQMSIISGIVWMLLTHYASMDLSRSDDENSRIERILLYIRLNYNQPISLQSLAEDFHFSVPYLSRLVKKTTGTGFVDYLSGIRLDHAVEDLRAGKMSVTQAALDNGFPNIASFYHAFRKRYPDENPAGLRSSTLQEEVQRKNRDSRKKLEVFLQQTGGIQEERMARIEADALSFHEYDRNWMKVLNLGAAEDLQRGRVQEQIVLLHSELNFTYGRIWSLFCRENMVDINAEGEFNFRVLDQILDFMVTNHIIPFLDLGIKFKRVLRNDLTPVMLNEHESQFKDDGQYQRLISEFIRHCLRRYGVEQVSQWKFEMWWNGLKAPEQRIDKSWLAKFEILYATIKAYVPEAGVGGYGMNTYSWDILEDYLREFGGNDLQPDFFTFSVFPYAVDRARLSDQALMPDDGYLEKAEDTIQKLLGQYCPAWHGKILIAEFNQSISSRDYLNDTCFKGAYLCRNVIASIGRVDGIAYWGSTDLIDEYYDSTGILCGSSGLITRDGIRKPAYYAFYLLNRLGSRLLARGSHYIVTGTGHDSYYILCTNMISPSMKYYLSNARDIHQTSMDQYFRDAPENMEIAIINVRPGNYYMSVRYMNSQQGSVYDEWKKMEFYADLGTEEIEYLRSVSIPGIRLSQVRVEADQVLRMKIRLQTNEFQLIHIYPE